MKKVPGRGFEPHNSNVLYKPPAHVSYLQPYSRANTPTKIRTWDPLLRRQMLYPAELWVHKKRAGGETRTRDNLIGNQILYQLSYTRIMLQAGLEPARPRGQQILSLLCLPIPPPERDHI